MRERILTWGTILLALLLTLSVLRYIVTDVNSNEKEKNVGISATQPAFEENFYFLEP